MLMGTASKYIGEEGICLFPRAQKVRMFKIRAILKYSKVLPLAWIRKIISRMRGDFQAEYIYWNILTCCYYSIVMLLLGQCFTPMLTAPWHYSQGGLPSTQFLMQFRSSSISLCIYATPLIQDINIWSRVMIMLCFASSQPLLSLLYKRCWGVTGPREAESLAKACLWVPGKAGARRQTYSILPSFEKQLRSTWLWTSETICLLSHRTFMICGFLVWLGFVF